MPDRSILASAFRVSVGVRAGRPHHSQRDAGATLIRAGMKARWRYACLLFGKSLTVTNVLARPAQPGVITLRAAMQRYFEVALYLLVLTGFGTLASTGGLDLRTVLLAGAAVLFRGYLLATQRSFLIPERWTTVLTVAYAGFYLLDYFFISGGFLNATIHLVIFVLVVCLFSACREC